MEWPGDRGVGPRRLARCCSWGALKRTLPFLSWLPQYSVQWMQLDIIAGFTVGLTVVPQALAYAEVAGLPVEYGLYSSYIGGFIYCLFGTSKDVTLGPTAIMSLLVAVYTSGDVSLAVLLTFLSGCIQLAMGLLKFGFLLDFISYPVIKAFTSAAAVTIGFSQVKNLLGLKDIPRQFVLQVYETFHKLPSARPGDAVLGFLCITFLMALKFMKEHFPRTYRGMPRCHQLCYIIVWLTTTARNAIVVVAAGLVAYSFHVMGLQPFILTGKTAEGLPQFQLPPFSEKIDNRTVPFSEMVGDIGAGLFIIPLMGLLESVAIARAFASQNDYRINTNQELLAIGLTNFLGSFLSAYPVTGSFGRTALNSQTGVCTPAGGILTGLLVIFSLGYLTPLFFYIPKAALAAVIICAVAPMFDLGICKTLWKVKKIDLLPFMVTFLLSFWEIQYGILIGILVSLIILCFSIARPKIKVVDPNGLTLMIMSGLSFPAVEYLRDAVHKKASTGTVLYVLYLLLQPRPFNLNRTKLWRAVVPDTASTRCSLLQTVVLDFTHVNVLDYTVVLGLQELQLEFQSQGRSLLLSGLQPDIYQILLAANMKDFQYPQSMMTANDLYEDGSIQPLLANTSKGSS